MDGSSGTADPETNVEDTEQPTPPMACHRRNCDEQAEFRVMERYQEETGKGAVEAEALLCAEHTEAECPSNLDSAYDGYVFHIEPYPASP